MIKLLQIICSFFLIFILNSPQTLNTNINSTNITNDYQDDNFGYPHIKIATNLNDEISKNDTNYWNDKAVKYTNTILINWKKYAKNWQQFLKNYHMITFFSNGYVDSWLAKKETVSKISIKVSDIENKDEWHDLDTLKTKKKFHVITTSSSLFWNPLLAGIYFDAIRDDDFIKIRFCLTTKYCYDNRTEMESKSEIALKITNGVIESLYDLEEIKKQLTDSLTQPITIMSDDSGSLLNSNNIKKITQEINNIIEKQLTDDYQSWKQYLQPLTFDNKAKQVTTTFKFQEPNTKKWVIWTFNSPIDINLTKDYWGKSLSQRLHINVGKIVNPLDSTKGMVDDVGLQLEPELVTSNYGGNIQFHTSASLNFDGALDSSEWIEVNGQKIEVLDNKFVYQMNDNRIDNKQNPINEYDIVVHHDDENYQEQYHIKYTINNDVPKFQAKWYAWNPDSNPYQKQLIEPTLANGELNPNYDKEINPKTGTKTQIIWVKNKSQYPFALDPLNENGEIITNANNYDLGFISEGSVSGMGVQQIFNDKEVESIYRKKVSSNLKANKDTNEINKLKVISTDKENKYWSWQGIWHYIIKAKDNFNYEKYVIIGQDYQNQYLKFLDVLNDPNVAVAFWDTIHGSHLKNYLLKVKNLDIKAIELLTFEQVSRWWKEYTSDVICQRVSVVKAIDTNSIDFIDPNQDLTTLKNNIINDIATQNNVSASNKILNSINDKNLDKKTKALNLNATKLQKQNMMIISIVVGSLVATFCLLAFFKYRFKKGIGGKKRKKK